MINPLDLANDVAGNVALLVFPAALWALIYLLAWEHPAFAEEVGFGRLTFWLLLPGALLASLVLLPIAPVTNDWLAVSFAGALFPLLVVGIAFARLAPPARRSLPLFVLLFAAETTALLVAVVAIRAPVPQLGAVVGVAAATPIAAGLVALRDVRPWLGRIALLIGLTSAVAVGTFVASVAVPGVGIEESFPAYLIPPAAVGVIAVVVAGRIFPGAEGFALPTAYIAGTLGVLVGADVLRQPPLYPSSSAGLYAIGGAGVFDLVYISGLLAFGAAYVTHRFVGRGFAPFGPPVAQPTPTPIGQLVGAFRSGVGGQINEALREASAASRESAAQALRLLDRPAAPDDRPWQGLPVPGWVVSDQANLDAAARAGSTDGREGFRAFLTARWLVLLGRELGLRRFASVRARTAAFGLDLLVLTLPAVALWTYLILTIHGTLSDLAANVTLNAAIYGYAAVAFFYFVFAETLGAGTLGKWALGVAVRDRQLRRPTFFAGLVRNLSKLPTLTLLGLGLAVGILLLLKAGGGATLTIAGGIPISPGLFDLLTILAVVTGGVGLFGLIGVLGILFTSERQRFGDLVAGTWVVRVATPAPEGPGQTGPPKSPGAGSSG